MDIIRASVLGFCGGVRRAVALLENASHQFGTIYTLHEIVHNAHVMDRLREEGVILVDSLSKIPDGATVALTAHGAPLSLIAGIQARHLNLIDATCPIVADAQRRVAENSKSGRFTIIFGDSQHLEVRSLLSHASAGAIAAESMEGLVIPSEGSLSLVAQTTKSPEALQAFACDLRAQLPDKTNLVIQDTTCLEPVARYRAARRLATDVDAIIVVGGGCPPIRGISTPCVSKAGSLPSSWNQQTKSIDLQLPPIAASASQRVPQRLTGPLIQ